MSIRFFINSDKSKVFYLNLGRKTPDARCLYPISYGIEYLDDKGKTEFATLNKIGKAKYSL